MNAFHSFCILSALIHITFPTCLDQYNCMHVSVDASDPNGIKVCMTANCGGDTESMDTCVDTFCSVRSCNDADKTIEIDWPDNDGCSTRMPTFQWPFRLSGSDAIYATCTPSIRSDEPQTMCQQNSDTESKCVWMFSIDSYCQTASANYPTTEPTPRPTSYPTTLQPTPTQYPSPEPTPRPTTKPSSIPTNYPTTEPTPKPTRKPSQNPTLYPTNYPTVEPTDRPSRITVSPISDPTSYPTVEPTGRPGTKVANSCTQRQFVTGVEVRCECFWNGQGNTGGCRNNNGRISSACNVMSGNQCPPQAVCCCSALDASTQDSCDFTSAMNVMYNAENEDDNYVLKRQKKDNGRELKGFKTVVAIALISLSSLLLGYVLIHLCKKNRKNRKKGYTLTADIVLDDEVSTEEEGIVYDVEITSLKT